MSTAPRWEVEGRDWPNRGHSRFVDAVGLRWHVQVMGPQTANVPVVLLLHGTGAATHSWRALAPVLARNFTIIAPDLPGHGFTRGRPVGGMAAIAQAVGGLMRVLDLKPHAIVGHSAGAAIAIRMTLDRIADPAAIVGLNSALLPFPGLAARLFPALARALFVNPIAPHIFARMARVPGETGRFLSRSTGSRIDAEGVACYERLLATSGHCAGALAMMANWDLGGLQRDMPRLTVPLMLLHGEDDSAIPLATARAAAKFVTNGELRPLAGLGHLAHEERPEEIAALVRQFLEKH